MKKMLYIPTLISIKILLATLPLLLTVAYVTIPFITLVFLLLLLACLIESNNIGLILSDFNLGILYMLAVSSLSTYGILLAN
jgi:NADH:ubiquinone oxidoreductase subunit H